MENDYLKAVLCLFLQEPNRKASSLVLNYTVENKMSTVLFLPIIWALVQGEATFMRWKEGQKTYHIYCKNRDRSSLKLRDLFR